MANNRMILVCNVCQPTFHYTYHDKGVYPIMKWYPPGEYYTGVPDEKLGKNLKEFLVEHQHLEFVAHNAGYTVGAGQENPIRLCYDNHEAPNPLFGEPLEETT